MSGVGEKVERKVQDVKNTFFSGGPGTTGREVFEDSTSTGPGAAYRAPGTAGATAPGAVGSGPNLTSSEHGHDRKTGVLADATPAISKHEHGAGHGHEHSGSHGGVNPGTGLVGPDSGVGKATHETTAEGFGGEHRDKVGGLGQGQAQYEGNLVGGPVTGGAAGTDRFDSEGATGPMADLHDNAHHDTSQRAPGKSDNPIASFLTTSDKEFTGRDRLGKGAYADTHGNFEKNTTGPAGNTALTGREGNAENNPVAQAKSRESGASGEHGEKKGLMQKVKDALH